MSLETMDLRWRVLNAAREPVALCYLEEDADTIAAAIGGSVEEVASE